jgi:hypothetical protein
LDERQKYERKMQVEIYELMKSNLYLLIEQGCGMHSDGGI